jgi:glycosyltransferase involved in cell wall biosynthesis
MRVLQVCSAEGLGGGEAHVADLVTSLVARGVAVDLAVRPSSALSELVADRVPGLTWHELPMRNALDIGSAKALGRIVEERAIDVVHAHVARDYPLAAVACRAAPRARLVMTRHHYLPLKGNPVYRRLLASATIIAVSDSVRATVIESLGVEAERVVTIPNWIDLARYGGARDRALERRRAGITRRVAVALVGQLTPLKGQEDFLHAAAAVSAERPDVEFLIVGEDHEPGRPFLARLLALTDTLGLRDTVRFFGYDRDLPGLFAGVDVVAVPSWNEAFSLVTAEAMAAGRAVVASRVGALAELVADGRTGILVPPQNPAALADAILHLASDPALVERLGRTARAASARFAREPRIDQVVALYERVLRKQPALTAGQQR